MLKCVIFDKDGVLVDTEDIIASAVARIIKIYSGKKFDKNKFLQLRGENARVTFSMLIKEYDLPLTVEEALEVYKEEHRKGVEGKSLIFEGVLDLLDDLKKNNIPFGIGTNSNRERTELTLKEIKDYFKVIVTADDVKYPKPAPDIFLAVGQRLGATPGECVVIGDTNKDIIAACVAGMKVVFLDHGMGLSPEKKPDMVIKSLKEINSVKLKELFI